MEPFVAGPQIHQEKEESRDVVGSSGLNYAARYPVMPQYHWTTWGVMDGSNALFGN